MEIDFDRLREDLIRELEAAYFGGGIGSALIDRTKAEFCSNEELISIALRYGFRLENYVVSENGHHHKR